MTGVAYVDAALVSELAAVRSAQPGGRNARLNGAAFALGGFVKAGVLDDEATRTALMDAALACGLLRAEAMATIQSGFAAAEPREVPAHRPDARLAPARRGHAQARPVAPRGAGQSCGCRLVETARYAYRNADGTPNRVVIRLGCEHGRKAFRQVGHQGQPVVLYRLPEVMGAVRAGQAVYLVEGEKDADRLAGMGVCGTTGPMGGSNIGKTDIGPLAGAVVVAVVDRDETGDRWAARLRAMLDGVVASVSFRWSAAGKDVSDHLDAGHTLDDLVAYVAPAEGETGGDAGSDRESKASTSSVLVRMATERYRIGRSPDGLLFGVPAGSHVVRELRGGATGLRAELAQAYWQTTGKVANAQALADAMTVIEGIAGRSDPESVHLRTAEHGGDLWIDLGDTAERVVRVSRGTWEVVTSSPVLFRRTATMGELPIPTSGDLDELWPVLNVAPDDRQLVRGWLVAALAMPTLPCPILALFGEQGTGKSSASKMLVSLVDPSPVPVRKAPKDVESWVTAATGSRLVALDNLSVVPDWLSDSLCRAVTGDGDVRRQLYTDGGLVVFSFRRAVILNGIDLGGLRGDLAERLIGVELTRIPDHQRRTEHDLDAEWRRLHPRLFAGLLNEIAASRAVFPSVESAKSPRMADFARLLAALDQIHGTNSADYYDTKTAALADDSLTSDVFIAAMIDSLTGEFEGTSAELLARVAPDGRPPRGWPTPRQATAALRRAAPALRKRGWIADASGKHRKSNALTWRLVPDRNCAGNDAATPRRRQTSDDKGEHGRRQGGVAPASPNTTPPHHPNTAASPASPASQNHDTATTPPNEIGPDKDKHAPLRRRGVAASFPAHLYDPPIATSPSPPCSISAATLPADIEPLFGGPDPNPRCGVCGQQMSFPPSITRGTCERCRRAGAA